MNKKRKHPAETILSPEEFTALTFDALTVAEDRIEKLWWRAARWKAVAKNYRDLYRHVYASRAKIIKAQHGGGQDD